MPIIYTDPHTFFLCFVLLPDRQKIKIGKIEQIYGANERKDIKEITNVIFFSLRMRTVFFSKGPYDT